jgi:hypothetical protein
MGRDCALPLLAAVWATAVVAVLGGIQQADSSAAGTPNRQRDRSESFQASSNTAPVLARWREAIGGESRLRSVESLMLVGQTTSIADDRTTAVTYRLLFPDGFQRVVASTREITFTAFRGAFWQRPDQPPSVRELAEKNLRRWHGEILLLFLARAPPGERMTVTEVPGAAAALMFEGELRRTIGFDPVTGRPRWLEHATIVTSPSANPAAAGQVSRDSVRRVTIDDYRIVSGIALPAVLTETWTEGMGALRTEYSRIVVDAGVSERDFHPPGQSR